MTSYLTPSEIKAADKSDRINQEMRKAMAAGLGGDVLTTRQLKRLANGKTTTEALLRELGR